MVHLELPDNWQDLAAGYVLNNLSEEEAWVWELLLKEYPELRKETQALDRAFKGLANTVPLYQPPANLLQKIHSTIETRQRHSQSQSQSQPFSVDQNSVPPVSSANGTSIATHNASESASASKSNDLQGMNRALRRRSVRSLGLPQGLSRKQSLSRHLSSRPWSRRVSRTSQVGALIAAGIIATLGIQNYSLQNQLQETDIALQQSNTQIKSLNRQLRQAESLTQYTRPVVQTLQQPGSVIFSLTGSNLATTASGRLVMSEEQQVVLVVQNLPQLPEEKVYRLWAAIETKDVVYCGQFNSNAEGIINLTPSSDHCSENPSQMIITLDAVTDPTTQGGPVVMQSSI